MSTTRPGRPTRPRVALSSNFQGYRPEDLWAAYDFPTEQDGSGVTVGLAEWGSGFAQADVDAYCRATGLPGCTPAFICVDNAKNDGGQHPIDLEATLDVEVAHAAAPGAALRVYEADPGATMATFASAVVRLLRFVLQDQNRPDILSISYGDAEESFPEASVRKWESLVAQLVAKGTLVLISSGDQGAYGMHSPLGPAVPHADAPSSCPSALSVGGTTLRFAGGQVVAEDVWNGPHGASGGGYSRLFSRPRYQHGVVQRSGRGLPDLAAAADPATGYFVIFEGNGQVVGGTSASCALVAGLFARILQARKAQGHGAFGDVHAAIYALQGRGFRDIAVGDNSDDGVRGYSAAPGWDACTGWGAPLGQQLLAQVVAAAPGAAPSADLAVARRPLRRPQSKLRLLWRLLLALLHWVDA